MRLGLAESGDRLAPVYAVAVGAALFARDFFTVNDQAGAAMARNNLFVQDAEELGAVGHLGIALWICALEEFHEVGERDGAVEH